jgi:hypothetical protein
MSERNELHHEAAPDPREGAAADAESAAVRVERIQLGIRVEKRMAKVLKATAELLDKSLGELVEIIVLHALEGALPFNEKTRRAIADLKRVYGMDYDLNAINRFVENTVTWQRFTERARRVVFFAQEEAARLGGNHVGTEHLLLGLIRESDSFAAQVLIEKMGIAVDRIRSEIARKVAPGHGNLGQDMQLTPQSKRVIDLAGEEAVALGNNYIGTEHLLLGLIRLEEGLASRVMRQIGADLESTRAAVRAMQATQA